MTGAMRSTGAVEWRPVHGWPAYSISSSGQLRRDVSGAGGHRPRVLAGHVFANGYRMVTLCNGRARWKVALHQLVALTFLGPKPSPAHEIAHWDGDRLNNAASNLRWATQLENRADAIRHGRAPYGETHGMAKLRAADIPEIRAAYSAGEKQRDIAKRYGVHQASIYRVVSGKTWNGAPRSAIAGPTMGKL